jgi:predicted nucleic-acid-binding Zn-ribbon protein
MPQSRECPKCAGSMAEGFTIDHTHGGANVATWAEGEPVKSIWVGLKLGGKTQIAIATWRCRRCGYLESYAAE